MVEIDRTSVARYWEGVAPSILGPYMMADYGFPVSAGAYRLRGEREIVGRLLGDIDRKGTALDLGSGIGVWTEEFAHSFAYVVSVEGSASLYPALKERCAAYHNIDAIHGDVQSFEPNDDYSLVFSGGLLMYLDQNDVVSLLQRLVQRLAKNGIILCRESTVRSNTETRQGTYPVVYRSIDDYERIFRQCGLAVQHVERNEPYMVMEMGCQMIDMWKRVVPEPLQALQVVGRLAYWGVRLGKPLIQCIPRALGTPFPKLENHYFVLEADSSS